jgi:hypothetical protein
MSGQLPSYLHRANNDGTFDSICIRCFETIASAKTEEKLMDAELEHKCPPTTLSQRPVKIRPN